METITKRSVAFFNYGFFYLTLVCMSIFVISFINEFYTNLNNNNSLKNISDFQLNKLERTKFGENRLVFSPNIDLSSRFNYNVKQIFIYVTVKYQIEIKWKVEKREDMIWWSIISNKRKSKKLLSRVVNNLPLHDLPNEVIIKLIGSRQPWVGKIGVETYFSKKFNLKNI